MDFFKQKSTLFAILVAFLLTGFQNSETDLHAQSTNTNEAEAKVVMVEYSDFQCPACAYFYPIVQKLKQTYGDQLVVKYRYFPLNMHRFAMLASRAAEAARNQGEYDAMRGLLFTNQEQWSNSTNPQRIFINFAEQIGLDMEQFKEDLNAAETQRIVMEQKKEGVARGVDATPSFFINGEKVVTLPKNYEQFKALIDIYMAEAEQEAAN